MRVKHEDYDTGVIVGRFQVHELHEVHRELIQSVCDSHAKVIIFLGLAPVVNTQNNPLDFEARKQMLLADFPDVNVLYMKDIPDDAVWSQHLDKQIHDLVMPGRSVVLYGGRDSFLNVYSGTHDTLELHSDVYVSGTEQRNRISRKTKASPDFRHGVVWAAANRFPTVFTTIDVAIFRDNCEKILLGRKEHETKYRLVGGFSEPRDDSFESTALRELKEETGLYTLGSAREDMTYLGSYNIDDWRYRGEVDSIRTMLFACEPLGTPKPDDDIVELKWFTVKELWDDHGNMQDPNYIYNQIVPQHHEILARSWEYGLLQQNLRKGTDNNED
jgi:bifunctional NMN adenylyltransferase/nudix hydrolase